MTCIIYYTTFCKLLLDRLPRQIIHNLAFMISTVSLPPLITRICEKVVH